MREIRAAIATAPHTDLIVENVRLRNPGPRELIVRIEASGLCHSDLNPLEGRTKLPAWPVVVGHEAVGIVEEVGDLVSDLRPGDRVIASSLQSCGRCYWCSRAQVNLCAFAAPVMAAPMVREDGSSVATWFGLGTYAEAMVISANSAVKTESTLPPEQLALVGCGVTTGFGAVVNTARVEVGASVAVIGVGGVGQSVVQGSRITGAARIIAIDPVALKRETALSLGATDVLDPTDVDAVAAVRDLTDGRGVDYSFEVAGRVDTAQLAYDVARRGGAITLVGAPSPELTVPWTLYDMMRSEKRVLGSLLGSANVHRDFARVVSLVEAGHIRLDSMVSARLSLDEVNAGLAAIGAGSVLRSVIIPDHS